MKLLTTFLSVPIDRWRYPFLIGALTVTVVLATSSVKVLSGDGTHPVTESSSSKTDLIWRDADHGGLNSLLLLLNIYGHVIDNDKFLRLMEHHRLPNTARDILTLAERFDFPLQARSVSPADIDTMPLPVIIHVDGDNPNEGAFHVLVGTNPSRVSYINGPAVVVSSMDKELFFREWSGVVIFPSRKISPAALPTFVAFAIAMTFTLLVGWPRAMSSRQRFHGEPTN